MKRPARYILFCLRQLMIVVIFAAVPVNAGTALSATYVQPRGTHIRWRILIPSPSPAAVIVTQYIRPGTDIIASSHPVSSYDRTKGVAKWLFSSIASGTLDMEIKISLPIQKKGEIHGEVMFKDALSNTTAALFMNPGTTKKALEGC